MATVMAETEFSNRTGASLGKLTAAIEEARNDAITKESMNKDGITSHNISPETELPTNEELPRTRTWSGW